MSFASVIVLNLYSLNGFPSFPALFLLKKTGRPISLVILYAVHSNIGENTNIPMAAPLMSSILFNILWNGLSLVILL